MAREFDDLGFSFESGHDLDGRKTRTCIAPKPVANPCFTGKFRNLTATPDSSSLYLINFCQTKSKIVKTLTRCELKINLHDRSSACRTGGTETKNKSTLETKEPT